MITKLFNLIALAISSFLSFSSYIITNKSSINENLIEQSCFAGYYTQNHIYGDGDAVEQGTYASIVNVFDLSTRDYVNEYDLSDDELIENGFYSRDFHDYEFINYSESKYQSIIDGDNINGAMWGPKDSYVNSTCKIRAYYHDIEYNSDLVTVMFDFTGFLVGDSLLMTAAHGLYRDVTVDMFDDEIDNKYFPGKVEVYGAIGLSDTWGSSYEYYAKATTVLICSSYMTYRTPGYDWALLRLDRPLGRELSFRKLAAPTSNFNDCWIIGYPAMNQFHLRLSAENTSYTFDSTRPIYEYSISAFDGMSGSPFYIEDTTSIKYDYQGKPYLASRAVYGMHVCSSTDYSVGYAITFSNDIVNLVDSLNEHCRPTSLELSFSDLNNQNLEEVHITLLGEYDCKINANGCSIYNGSLVLAPYTNNASYISIGFPFPVSDLKIIANNGQQVLPNLNVELTYFDDSENNSSSIQPYNNNYNVYGTYIKDMSVFNIGNQNLIISNLEFDVEWDYIPHSMSAPSYSLGNFDENTTGENCVSYALLGISNFAGGAVLPKNSAGNELNLSTDLFPGRIISGLKRSLLAINVEMTEIGKYDICEENSYKVAIVCDPYHYYHVIRQNNGGSWSHYVVGSESTTNDSCNMFINIPSNASFFKTHNGQTGQETSFDATTFVGYFSVRSLIDEEN